MSRKGIKETVKKASVLLLIFLLINLPLVTALEISEVRADEITDSGAVILWETDEAADSFVSYSKENEVAIKVGDARSVNQHQVALESLLPGTAYTYTVESSNVVDNTSHSFTTLPADEEAPLLDIELPPVVGGSKIVIVGATEEGAKVILNVNGNVVGETRGSGEGTFRFEEVFLTEEDTNTIVITSEDDSGNVARYETTLRADVHVPKITFIDLPEVVEERLVTLRVSFSENVSYEVFANNRSVLQGENNAFAEDVSLDEGKNILEVSAMDAGGHEVSEKKEILSDTQAPNVEFEIEKGYNYYQGRAESDIHGTTEPGATVYLYVYKPLGHEFRPEFDRARAKVKANSEGEFTFEEVEFEISILDSLDRVGPKKVPSGLQERMIFPIQEVTQQEDKTYYIFVIAEDKTKKSGYAEKTVQVQSCYSQNLDFSVQSLVEFQAPLRLVPNLLDEGRQEIQAVFRLEYLGEGLPALSPDGQTVIEQGYRLNDVDVEKACTQAMRDDEDFGIACKILNRRPEVHESPDGSAVYVKWRLDSAAEMSEREKDFWNDFKKRQIVFPLKLRISYQDRVDEDERGKAIYSKPKMQTSCYDLGYFVDIPIESEELIPDFLAEEGVDSLTWTIERIQEIRPYLEQVYIITGFVAIGSWMLRTVARWVRILTGKTETYYSYIKPERIKKDSAAEDHCPGKKSGLYMQDTLDNWRNLNPGVLPKTVKEAFADEEKLKGITLEERCPSTAAAWEFEAALDQAFRWSWDRAFCRSVPAKWTEDKTDDQIGSVILKQQQCTATGRGVPLMKVEDCHDRVVANPVHLPSHIETSDVSVCWRTADGSLYVRDLEKDRENTDLTNKRIYHLTGVGNAMSDIGPLKDDLLVHQPDGAEGYVVGKDVSCNDVCKSSKKKRYEVAGNGYGKDKACYTEKEINGETDFFSKDNTKIIQGYYAAGFTNDCFIDDAGNLQQCVCKGEKAEAMQYSNDDLSLRTAVPKEGAIEEEWFYRQDRVFFESKKKAGTHYPTIRYYAGRDFSGAFGQNYLLDYFKPDSEEVHEINPHTQILGTFQSVCLAGILKRLAILEGVLVGMRNCLVEAKYTGLHDAGMCKSLFTQQVCGLLYKAIAYLAKDCSPSNFDDVGKEGPFGDVGFFVDEGLDSMVESLDSSIADVKRDYGNAALNNYFEAGTQGFVQSMCLAAFGYEFPLFSEEFLLEAAYAFPVETVVVMAPKTRELSTYNPEKKTAVFNYDIGGAIIAGCKIRNYKVSLKCVGNDDMGNPGLDTTCNGEGCDCLKASGSLEPGIQRTKVLHSGGPVASGAVESIPLESPQVIESPYRYDHMIVEIHLDPSESDNAANCFPDGYSSGLKGVYYEPIKDVSPPGLLSCSASLTNGKYQCPELSKLFGGSGAYLEPPYVSCYNERTDSWTTDCLTTPDLFIDGDVVKVRPHIYTDGAGYCIKRTINQGGLKQELPAREISEGSGGSIMPVESIATVNDEMFGGEINQLRKVAPSSDGCKHPDVVRKGRVESTAGPYTFSFTPVGGDKLEVTVPRNINVERGYSLTNGDNLLAKNGATSFTVEEINRVVFTIDNIEMKNVMGNVDTGVGGRCSYRVQTRSALGESKNAARIDVTYTLLHRDSGGSCRLASTKVERTTGGLAEYTARIRVQKEMQVFQEDVGLHDQFVKKNYEGVMILSNDLTREGGSDINEALGIYYGVAGAIMQGEKEGDVKKRHVYITNLLKLFFERKWGDEIRDDFDQSTKDSEEYDKIKIYLEEVADEFGYDT